MTSTHTVDSPYEKVCKENDELRARIKDLVNAEVVTIPLAEFKDHVKRVDFLVTVMNGILSGMSQHPMGRMMMPPEVLMQLQATLPGGGK